VTCPASARDAHTVLAKAQRLHTHAAVSDVLRCLDGTLAGQQPDTLAYQCNHRVDPTAQLQAWLNGAALAASFAER
jgi:hypothetical protein